MGLSGQAARVAGTGATRACSFVPSYASLPLWPASLAEGWHETLFRHLQLQLYVNITMLSLDVSLWQRDAEETRDEYEKVDYVICVTEGILFLYFLTKILFKSKLLMDKSAKF
jgi:hypothetical protein